MRGIKHTVVATNENQNTTNRPFKSPDSTEHSKLGSGNVFTQARSLSPAHLAAKTPLAQIDEVKPKQIMSIAEVKRKVIQLRKPSL